MQIVCVCVGTTAKMVGGKKMGLDLRMKHTFDIILRKDRLDRIEPNMIIIYLI